MRKLAVLLFLLAGAWKLGLVPTPGSGGRAKVIGRWRPVASSSGSPLQREMERCTLQFFRDGSVLHLGGPFGEEGLGGAYAVDGDEVHVQLGADGTRYRSGRGGGEYELSPDGDALTTTLVDGTRLVYRRAAG